MSNTVIIWIGLPAAVSLLLILLQRWQKITAIIATLLPLILAGLAGIFSNDLVLSVAGRQFILEDSLVVFGRIVQINASQLGIVSLLYFVCFAWNALSRLFDESRWFNSLSLFITALWVSVQFVNPFIYSAVIIELIALTSVPLLSPRGTPAKKGIIRFLSMQTLALPLILVSGWMVTGIETSPSAQALVLRGTILVLLGFVLWVGIFPLHSWIPMLTEESPPWTVSFLLVMMQVGFALFFLKFLNQYGWLRTLPELDTFLKWIGVFCILWAGIIAAFQTDLNRLLGYFFLAETGYIAFSMAYRGTNGLEVMAMTFVTRFLAHWALAITLSSLQRLTGHQSLSFDTLRGVIHRYPFVSILLICSLLNVIGMPLFSLYPTKHIIWNLVSSDNLALALLVAVGIFGMLTMFLRLFSAIIHPEIKSAPTTSEEPGTETIGLKIMVILILLVIVLPGIFPDILSRPLLELLVSFENLTH